MPLDDKRLAIWQVFRQPDHFVDHAIEFFSGVREGVDACPIGHLGQPFVAFLRDSDVVNEVTHSGPVSRK